MIHVDGDRSIDGANGHEYNLCAIRIYPLPFLAQVVLRMDILPSLPLSLFSLHILYIDTYCNSTQNNFTQHNTLRK